jgi:hypothetical protein
MTCHAEDALGCPRIAEVLNLSLAVPAAKASGAECLLACEDGQVLNLIVASTTAVCAVVAYQRSVTEQEQVRIGVEEGAASVAAETIEMPSVASKFKCFSFLENLSAALAREDVVIVHGAVEVIVHDGGHGGLCVDGQRCPNRSLRGVGQVAVESRHRGEEYDGVGGRETAVNLEAQINSGRRPTLNDVRSSPAG